MTTPELQRVEPSFEEYVAGRGGALLRSAWLLTGDRGQAQQLVATALGKAVLHWRHVGEEDGLYDAYVRRVLMATYLGRWRRRWAPVDLTVVSHASHAVSLAVSDADDGSGGAAGASTEALRLRVADALAVLSRAQRAVVVLRFFEGLTEAQTAETLDCTMAAVRRRTAHALAALGDTELLGASETTSA
ncbi:MAG TPA: sigma factor-like helix-turn-helix DNA-binding protein [Pedococcus sp.]|nr:sigma factor-like helix-turn-helix DNA-binding protein [Pedococcus sp.]